MPHLLITSGPTREYLDPVRYLSNASSGKMGRALAIAGLASGFEVTIVSGPVEVEYPTNATVHWVISTEEMLKKCLEIFPDCDLVIGSAAPCDFQPKQRETKKITKNGEPLNIELTETPDILAELGQRKNHQYLVAFALETHDHESRAVEKLKRKNGDFVLLNNPTAIQSDQTEIDILDLKGKIHARLSGPKESVAHNILTFLKKNLRFDRNTLCDCSHSANHKP